MKRGKYQHTKVPVDGRDWVKTCSCHGLDYRGVALGIISKQLVEFTTVNDKPPLINI